MLFQWLTLFLDLPGQSFDAGVAVWREVTGSDLSPFRGPAGEFATLLPSDGDAYLRAGLFYHWASFMFSHDQEQYRAALQAMAAAWQQAAPLLDPRGRG